MTVSDTRPATTRTDFLPVNEPFDFVPVLGCRIFFIDYWFLSFFPWPSVWIFFLRCRFEHGDRKNWMYLPNFGKFQLISQVENKTPREACKVNRTQLVTVDFPMESRVTVSLSLMKQWISILWRRYDLRESCLDDEQTCKELLICELAKIIYDKIGYN